MGMSAEDRPCSRRIEEAKVQVGV